MRPRRVDAAQQNQLRVRHHRHELTGRLEHVQILVRVGAQCPLAEQSDPGLERFLHYRRELVDRHVTAEEVHLLEERRPLGEFDRVEVAVLVEELHSPQRLGQPDAASDTVVHTDLRGHRDPIADDLPDALRDLPHQSRPVVDGAAVLVLAAIEQRAQKRARLAPARVASLCGDDQYTLEMMGGMAEHAEDIATGVDLIRRERERQITRRYTIEHDRDYRVREFEGAALALILNSPNLWPFSTGLEHFDSRQRNRQEHIEALAQAGALIAAALDLLQNQDGAAE
jgi:hypothetical protein